MTYLNKRRKRSKIKDISYLTKSSYLNFQKLQKQVFGHRVEWSSLKHRQMIPAMKKLINDILLLERYVEEKKAYEFLALFDDVAIKKTIFNFDGKRKEVHRDKTLLKIFDEKGDRLIENLKITRGNVSKMMRKFNSNNY